MKNKTQFGYAHIGIIALFGLIISFSLYILLKNIPQLNKLDTVSTEISKENEDLENSIQIVNMDYYIITQTTLNNNPLIIASTDRSRNCSPYLGNTCYIFYKEDSNTKILGEIANFHELENINGSVHIYTQYGEGLNAIVELFIISGVTQNINLEIEYSYKGMGYPKEYEKPVNISCNNYDISDIGTYRLSKFDQTYHLVLCGTNKILIGDGNQTFITKELENPTSNYNEDMFSRMKTVVQKNYDDPNKIYFTLSDRFIILDPNFNKIEIVNSL